jgi:hypothetical protein
MTKMNQKYHISKQEENTSLLAHWTKKLTQSIHFGVPKLAPVWLDGGPESSFQTGDSASVHFNSKTKFFKVIQEFIKKFSKILVINIPLKQGLTKLFQMIKLIK